MKWFEYLADWEKPISKGIERKLIPEKTPWYGIPLQLSLGSVPKQWQQKSKFIGDTSSRGWLGPWNLWSTGEEGKNAFGEGTTDTKGSRTTKGLKIAGTVAAILGSMYGLGSAGGAMMSGSGSGAGAGSSAGASGATAGTTAGTIGGTAATSGTSAGTTGATAANQGWWAKWGPYIMKAAGSMSSGQGQGQQQEQKKDSIVDMSQQPISAPAEFFRFKRYEPNKIESNLLLQEVLKQMLIKQGV